jgi:streptomycin 6-kinase
VVKIPREFAQHIRTVFAERGRAWLERLPSLVDQLVEMWQLTLGEPFGLSYNYVVGVQTADGSAAVLKIGVPDPVLTREAAALRLYAGEGACRLLDVDQARGALLLERLVPGELLVNLARTDDDEATRVGARVMRKLWRPVPHDTSEFRLLEEWFAAFDRHRVAYGGPGPIPARVLERAETFFRQLLESSPEQVVLHGDFHHYNVLSAQRADWLAIDPKGMLGDPGYEVGPFLCNPWLAPPAVLQRRLDILSEELAYDRDRLRDWCIAYAVLSACWSAEDEGSGWEDAITVAESLLRA